MTIVTRGLPGAAPRWPRQGHMGVDDEQRVNLNRLREILGDPDIAQMYFGGVAGRHE